ncbi:MAG: TIGR02556 family CRISPR-associated protein, partial [bacterium]
MIQAIKDIGEYAIKSENKSINDPLDILIDDPEPNHNNPKYRNILLMKISKDFNYKGIDVEEYSRRNIKKYLYRQGSPNGTDITPTSRITTIEKTLIKIKILPWFKKYLKYDLKNNDDFLNKIYECLLKHKNTILNDLNSIYKGFDKNTNAVLSLKINDKYIGEIDIFRRILLNEAEKIYYTKFSLESKGKDKICCICNKQNKEVFGFVGTYKFYTVDKPGFVSGGFKQKNAWINYPVCLSCALKLEEGKNFLHNNLDFNFYGFRYHLIPKFLLNINYNKRDELLYILKNWKNPKFDKKGIKEFRKLTDDEDEILELMSEQKNFLNMNFMFYDAPKGYDGSVFNILLYIEDILPSRLKKLFEVKKEVENIDIFNNLTFPLIYNFKILRYFFPKVSNNRTYDKYFLDIVRKIISNRPVDYNFIIKFIIRRIREDFISNINTKISTLNGFMLLNYLNKLKILGIEEEKIMSNENLKVIDFNEKNSKNDFKVKINKFFSEFNSFFNCSEKKAIFLEGVLTQKLLNIQFQERNSTPFRVKLKSLKLDEKQIKKILPEIQNKLEEYNKNYYKNLESLISELFILAG